MATINNGRDYKHVELDEGGYPVIGSGGEFTRASEFLYSGESVLLGRKGTIDKPLYINGAFWIVDTIFYTQTFDTTLTKYLYYCSLTIRFDLYSTSTALPSMTQADLAGVHFGAPKIEEQTVIANFLDHETSKIDALIAEQEKLITLLAEKRQATISQAVTKGLEPTVPMKDSGVEWLGMVPEHWAVKRLKQICQVFPSNVDKKSYEDELPIRLCNYTDVYYNETITEKMELMAATATAEQIAKFTLRAGDVIITKDSETSDDIAIPAYVPNDLPNVVCGYHLSMVRANNGNVGRFIKRLFDGRHLKANFEVLYLSYLCRFTHSTLSVPLVDSIAALSQQFPFLLMDVSMPHNFVISRNRALHIDCPCPSDEASPVRAGAIKVPCEVPLW